MEVVLIQGNANSGKTTLSRMIEKCLIKVGFELEKNNKGEGLKQIGTNEGNKRDFTAFYKKENCRIIINSESEEDGIDRFRDMYNTNKSYDECTIIITAIRKINTKGLRNKMIDIYKKDFLDDKGAKKEEYVIDLNIERKKFDELDFCEFIETVLNIEGKRLLGEIKKKLNCKIEIDCNSIFKSCK